MNKKLLHTLLIFGFVIMATSSCERDDICAETTPTTPHLIIRFYDISNPDETKIARRLSVRGFDENDTELPNIFENQDLDSIVLPLKFQNDDPATESKFILEKDSDYEDDNDDTTSSNIDIITISYTPEFIYVSRACGYKSIFTNASVVIENDPDNWILSNELLTTTIENETSAHLILRH